MLRAGIGPQNTVVVVNADSFASKAVANEYVLQRHVPACNIVELRLNPPDVDLRSGNRGAQKLALERFRCLADLKPAQ